MHRERERTRGERQVSLWGWCDVIACDAMRIRDGKGKNAAEERNYMPPERKYGQYETQHEKKRMRRWNDEENGRRVVKTTPPVSEGEGGCRRE